MSGKLFLVWCDILTLHFVTLTWLMEDRQVMNVKICSVLNALVSYNEGFRWLAAGWQWRANQSSTWTSNICTTICFLPVESCALSWKCYQSAFFIIWFEWLTRRTNLLVKAAEYSVKRSAEIACSLEIFHDTTTLFFRRRFGSVSSDMQHIPLLVTAVKKIKDDKVINSWWTLPVKGDSSLPAPKKFNSVP